MRDYKDWRPFLVPDPDEMLDVTPPVERARRVSWYEERQSAARSRRHRRLRRARLFGLAAVVSLAGIFALPPALLAGPTVTLAFSLAATGYAIVEAWMAHVEIGQPVEL